MEHVTEQHFKPDELAKAWKLHVATVRRMFIDEPGVLKVGRQRPGRKREYTTMRIPASVAERVYQQRAR